MNVRSSYEVSLKWTKPVFMFLFERSWMLGAGCRVFFRLRRIEPGCFTSKPEGRNGCATIVSVIQNVAKRNDESLLQRKPNAVVRRSQKQTSHFQHPASILITG